MVNVIVYAPATPAAVLSHRYRDRASKNKNHFIKKASGPLINTVDRVFRFRMKVLSL